MNLLGTKFPQMVVNTTQGTFNLPEHYNGKWFILFSHPGDFTPVCTTEFVAFQNMLPEFSKRNTELIGLSVDQVYAHLKWIEWINNTLGVDIQFPVIEDPLGNISNQLGMLRENDVQPVRSVFIVDDNGIIRLILTYPKEVGRNIYEILRALDALQIATKYKVATPANWPNNDLIKKDVILPAPRTEQQIADVTAKEKEGNVKCFDWWFCYKPLSNTQTK